MSVCWRLNCNLEKSQLSVRRREGNRSGHKGGTILVDGIIPEKGEYSEESDDDEDQHSHGFRPFITSGISGD